MDYLSMTFKQPAAKWYEALPLGNGSMGAMSYGRFQNEKIELTLTPSGLEPGSVKKIQTRRLTGNFSEITSMMKNIRKQKITAGRMCLVIGQKVIFQLVI